MRRSRASRTETAAEQLAHRGQDLERHLGRLGRLHDSAGELLVGAGDGEEHLVGAEVAHDGGQRGRVADHGHAEQGPHLLAGVVVDHDDGDEAGVGGPAHLAHDGGAGRAGADDGHPAGRAVDLAAEAEEPVLEADQAHEHGGHDRPEDHHRTREREGPPVVGQVDDDPGGDAGEHDAPGLGHAGVAPDLAVEAPRQVGDQVGGHGERQELEQALRVGGRDVAVEVQGRDQYERPGDQHHVDERDGHVDLQTRQCAHPHATATATCLDTLSTPNGPLCANRRPPLHRVNSRPVRWAKQ